MKKNLIKKLAVLFLFLGMGVSGWGAQGDLIYTLDLNAQSSAFGTSSTYANKSGTVSGVLWYANAASCQSTSAVWLGTNNVTNRTSLTILSAGVNGRGGAIATALSSYTGTTIMTSTVGYYAIVASNAIANVGSIKVNALTNGGTAPSTLWCLYSIDGGTTYTVLSSKTSPGTTEQTFAPASTIASAQYAFVFYSTAWGTYKTPYFKFYEGAPSVVAPTLQSSAINFSNITSSGMQIDWTSGNGTSRAVFVKETSGSITNPSDATTYTASSNWSSKGTQLGSSGYYCVYNGTGTTVTLSNLTAGTSYYVQAFEYNGTGATSKYYTATATGNPNNQATSGSGCTPQTISFGSLTPVTYGGATFTLSATATSGLPVSYSSSLTSVATVSGNTVTIVGPGSTIITATQGGNGTYCAAPSSDQTLTVNTKALTVSSAAANNKTYTGTNEATISGTLAGIVGSDVITLVGTGTFASVNVADGISVTSTSTLGGAAAAKYTLTQPTGLTANITKADQTITFGVLDSKQEGSADFNLTGTASSNLTVTFASSDLNVATISGNTVTIVGIGTTTITASQSGNGNFNSAPEVTQTLTVTPAPIIAWQFGSPASLGSETTYNATTNNTNLNISILSRGSGITATALARGFSANAWEATSKATAISSNEYYEFSIQAKVGYKVSLATLDATLRRTSTGPNAYIWKYSLDGNSFNEIGTDVSFTSTVEGVAQSQINLSGISGLQNVANGTTIKFRIYAWGCSNATATFALARYAADVTTNCLAIGGTVTPLSTEPTNHPSSFAASNNSTSSITLTWADNDGTQAASGFLVMANTSNSFTNPVDGTAQADGALLQNIAHGTQTATFSSLTPNTTYYFKIYPYNGSSSAINYKTDGTVPTSNYTTLPLAPTATNASTIGENSFVANWNAITGVTDFTIDVSTASNFGSFVGSYTDFSVSGTSASISGLAPATTYYYRLRYNKGGTNSDYSNTIIVYSTRPTACTAINFSTVSNNQITISWTRGNGAGVLVKVSNAPFTVGSRPSDGSSTYTCDANYTGTGEQWVYDGTGTSVVVNLPEAYDVSQLNVAVFEYATYEDGGAKAITKVYNLGKIEAMGGAELNLPIQLLQFVATKTNKGNLVLWSTASELNNSYFSLERSVDAKNFAEIAHHAGVGNSNDIHTYKFLDGHQASKSVYYRLKQTDFDGKFTYSKIISLQNDFSTSSQIISAYNNNAKGLSLTLKIANASAAEIEISDINGKTMYKSKSTFAEGIQECSLPFSAAGGTYFVRIQLTNEVLIKKIRF